MECKDGITGPTFLETTCVAFKCIARLKPALQAEALRQKIALFHRRTKDVFQSAAGAVPWEWQPDKNCFTSHYSPIAPRNISLSGH